MLAIKSYFKLCIKIFKHTYGYFLVDDVHLTSFAAWSLKKKVCSKCLLGTKNTQATRLLIGINHTSSISVDSTEMARKTFG